MPDVLYGVNDGVATITLNRPEKRNAVSKAMNLEILRIAGEVNADPAVRVLVVKGAGEKAFCAGSDIGELDPAASPWDVRNRPTDYTHAVRSVRKPTIAMVRGFAVGGGLELALACDIRYAAEDARFAATEVRLGWVPGGGASQLLVRMAGYGRAMELLLTGRFVDAREALEIGLVERVLPAERLEEETYRLAEEIARLSPVAAEAAKQAARIALNTPIEIGMQYENELFTLCFGTRESSRGIEAWKHRKSAKEDEA